MQLTSLRSVLCLGAHADDIEIGCGGTILRLLQDNPGADGELGGAQRPRVRVQRKPEIAPIDSWKPPGGWTCG